METKIISRAEETLQITESFQLECGEILPELSIHYTTYGELNEEKSNVVWVFQALTANSDPVEWWPGLVGEGCVIDPEKYFVVCANMIGSCYGSTEPDSFDFPLITIRDVVNANRLVYNHLGLDGIKIGMGGSMGGQQLLQWAVEEPNLFEYVIPIATNAVHSPWGIAFNEAQRMALKNPNKEEGLAAARAIAMLSYRTYRSYEKTQIDEDDRRTDFSASSYQQYQGKKLVHRFSPFSYLTLSRAMDSHNVGIGSSVSDAINRINSRGVVIGMESDILFPLSEQRLIADNLRNASFHAISSEYGHDGFLIEVEQISRILREELMAVKI
ncbi:MAG: homoserine O-acetyltransferase [Cyclobacteriaceae bacterium]